MAGSHDFGLAIQVKSLEEMRNPNLDMQSRF
jgi:hypothetical protein